MSKPTVAVEVPSRSRMELPFAQTVMDALGPSGDGAAHTPAQTGGAGTGRTPAARNGPPAR